MVREYIPSIKLSTLLSNILKKFNQEIHNPNVESKNDLQAQKEKLLAHYKYLKNDTSEATYKSQEAPCQGHINYNKYSGYQIHTRCQNNQYHK